MASILQLSPYPVKRPLHGGQHRVLAIQERLRAAGHKVRTVSVVVEGFYPGPEHDQHTVVIPRRLLAETGLPMECYDLGISQLLRSDATVRGQVIEAANNFRPDAVVLEQPWLLPAVDMLKDRGPLVYSSQNVEHELKRGILGGEALRYQSVVDEILALELDAAGRADLVVAVSDHDATWFASMGTSAIVAKNGTRLRRADPSAVAMWRNSYAPRRTALFVASGHPPNVEGFWSMLGPSLGFLPPTAVVVVAGGVSGSLFNHKKAKAAPASNPARVGLVGVLDEKSLGALLEASDCIVLPILVGGGTNLKTAEALVTDKPIVATSHAFRGFEQFADSPGVVIADEPNTFRRALLETLTTTSIRRFQRSGTDSLLWEQSLTPLVRSVESLLASVGSAR